LSDELRTIGWRVSGRVQGVGFRWFVLLAARRLEIEGDVRNLPDGRVEIRSRASDSRLQEFRSVVLEGPSGARVDRIERYEEREEFPRDGFQIRN
jgi:acylphosphatase